MNSLSNTLTVKRIKVIFALSTMLILNTTCRAFAPATNQWQQKTPSRGKTTTLVTADEYNQMQQHGIWMYQNKFPITYERREVSSETSANKQEGQTNQKEQSPVLLLNGFGMGTFHQHRLMEALGDSKYTGALYGIDYLGHGGSWPVDCDDGNSESELGLRYCADTWIDQIIQFIEDVILKDVQNNNKKVSLVGNSVGGYLAGCIAAARPDLVESVVLINATPVWGLNLPGWDGQLPAPPVPKLIGRALLDFMRNEDTIRTFLRSTYANAEAYCEDFIKCVRDCASGKGGHAAFASILWSPPAQISLKDGTSTSDFYKCLENIHCDVLVCFGTEDKACKRVFAKRMMQHLQKRSSKAKQRYIELSNVGHCANHEAPNAMSYLLNKFFSSNEKYAEEKTVRETWGETTLQERLVHEIPLSLEDQMCDQLMNFGKNDINFLQWGDEILTNPRRSLLQLDFIGQRLAACI